jgi:hypothetical protein
VGTLAYFTPHRVESPARARGIIGARVRRLVAVHRAPVAFSWRAYAGPDGVDRGGSCGGAVLSVGDQVPTQASIRSVRLIPAGRSCPQRGARNRLLHAVPPDLPGQVARLLDPYKLSGLVLLRACGMRTREGGTRDRCTVDGLRVLATRTWGR